MRQLGRWFRHSLLAALVSLAGLSCVPNAVAAHEVLPAIADFSVDEDRLELSIRADVEAIMAGLDLSSTQDGGTTPEDAIYEDLRALSAEEIVARFQAYWPSVAGQILVTADGTPLFVDLRSVAPPVAKNPSLSRVFTVDLVADLPKGARTVTIGWAANLGPLILRQNGVDAAYNGYLEPGVISPPIAIMGGGAKDAWPTFADYIPIGFQHIVPKGLDHILFVLGLFLFDTRLRQLLLQISAFTAAHTVTLAAAASNVIVVPSALVEPAIAISIIYIAVENILAKGTSPLRLPLVFIFGLLHGLGFASVLAEFGLPERNYLPALLGFNLGVEIGQLTVVATAFGLIGLWFNRLRLYRALVVIPGSALIGLAGAMWLVQRVT
jgi:hypothetical protein